MADETWPVPICGKCGSPHQMDDLQVVSDTYDVNVVFIPGSFLNFARKEVVRATVCANCGHVEFYVPGAGQMWDEWRQRNNQG